MNDIYKKYFTTIAMVWVACFALLFFAYLLIIKPQSKLKNKLTKQLTEHRQNYQATLTASTEEARVRLGKEIKQFQDKLREYVTDSEGSADLTFDISRIANDTKVSSFSIKSKNSRAETEIPQCEYIAENQINISFNGNFNQFAGFLNSLERHQPVVFVDWFSIKRPRDGAVESDIDMGLSVFVEKRLGS